VAIENNGSREFCGAKQAPGVRIGGFVFGHKPIREPKEQEKPGFVAFCDFDNLDSVGFVERGGVNVFNTISLKQTVFYVLLGLMLWGVFG
jgi:hypothetical protein